LETCYAEWEQAKRSFKALLEEDEYITVMDYSKFSLGLRFAMTSDATTNPAGLLEHCFCRSAAHLYGGCKISLALDDVGAAECEAAYICMFFNLPLKVGKALYDQLQQKPALLSHLTIY
jgi:hypothetical protein